MIEVTPGAPKAPQATALLKASHGLMKDLFPPEDNFFLDINELTAPHIRFFVAREGDEILGTGALAIMEGYGEVKSMFTSEAARGTGVAAAILRAIEDTARDTGLAWLNLETGDRLHAAHRLYARHGFQKCGTFGDYGNPGSSIFMEKRL